MGLLRRHVAGSSPSAAVAYAGDHADLANCDCTLEFLTMTEWSPGGDPRTPGTVLFFYDSGRLKVMLNDKDASMVAFGCASLTGGLWEEVEGMLLAKDTDWRPSRPSKSR